MLDQTLFVAVSAETLDWLKRQAEECGMPVGYFAGLLLAAARRQFDADLAELLADADKLRDM